MALHATDAGQQLPHPESVVLGKTEGFFTRLADVVGHDDGESHVRPGRRCGPAHDGCGSRPRPPGAPGRGREPDTFTVPPVK